MSVVSGYEYTTNSSYSADSYHVSMYIGVATTNTGWVHSVGYTLKNAVGNQKYVDLTRDITSVTGNYYLGFELLSNSHPYGVNITHARLLGRTYQ